MEEKVLDGFTVSEAVVWLYREIKKLENNSNNNNSNTNSITQTQLDTALDSKVDKGGYIGTAQDLKNAIDTVNSKTINWNDIQNKPNLNYLSTTGGTVNGNITANSIIKKNSSNDKVLLGGGGEINLSELKNDPVGNIINGTRQILPNEADKVIFVTNSIDNCAFNVFPDRCSVTFRKVFDGGYVNFTCLGKQIIYTGDNQFNGKKGSTAVVSIYGNDCYIDIRNV